MMNLTTEVTELVEQISNIQVWLEWNRHIAMYNTECKKTSLFFIYDKTYVLEDIRK